MRDRQHLAEDGIMIVVMTLERHSNVVLAGPDIVSRGFVYVKEAEELMAHAKKLIVRTVDECTRVRGANWATIKSKVKSTLSSYLYNKTKRSPMILPIIIEV